MGHFFCPSLFRRCLRKSTAFLSIKATAPLAELVYQVDGISWGSDLILSRIHNLVTNHSSRTLGTWLGASGPGQDTQEAEVNRGCRFYSLVTQFLAACVSHQRWSGGLLKQTVINYSLKGLVLFLWKGLEAALNLELCTCWAPLPSGNFTLPTNKNTPEPSLTHLCLH